MLQDNKQALLKQAVALVGLAEVCKALNAPAHLVEAWISGHANMPDQILLELAAFLDSL